MVDGTVLDPPSLPPEAEGMVDADGVMAPSGVSLDCSPGELAGELTGGTTELVGDVAAVQPQELHYLKFLNSNLFMISNNKKEINLPLHWPIGGVWTLQAPGRDRARVWLIVIPSAGRPPPLRTEQRHWGDPWTTLPSCEQHEDEGVLEFPVT